MLRVLPEKGNDRVPVNPRRSPRDVRGLRACPSLASINCPVDVVKAFRRPDDLTGIAKEAISIDVEMTWGQIGVVDHDAARLAGAAGLNAVMEGRWPKFELVRPLRKPGLDV